MWILTENNVIINTDHVHCNMVDNAIVVELTTLVRRAIQRAKEVSASKQKILWSMVDLLFSLMMGLTKIIPNTSHNLKGIK